MISTLLRAEALTAGYGSLPVLREVSLIVSPGEIVAVLGPDGAGKSTACRAIAGLLRPGSGRVIFDGRDITGLRPDRVFRHGLAYVPQGRVVFPEMTVLENLEMGAHIEPSRQRIREALERVYALFPVLAERRGQPAGTLSGGERQMVAIGRGLMTVPKLLLLDEPSLGLSARLAELLFERLAEMRRAGSTLLIVERSAARALALADRGYVLEGGRNRLEGTGASLLGDPEVRRLYLGGRDE